MTPEELTKRRQRLGLTQREAAAIFDVHPVTWAKWEIGKQPMRFPRVLRFALERLADDKAACGGNDQCWQDKLARWTAGEWAPPGDETPCPAS